MKAITFQSVERLRFETVDDPGIEQAGDVIVRVLSAGICGSDLHVYHGRETGLDAGTIHNLQHHPRYPIHVCQVDMRAHIKVFDYVADAEYELGIPVSRGRDHELVTADFKPKAAAGLDPVFELKRKCFEAQYGRPVTVITEI